MLRNGQTVTVENTLSLSSSSAPSHRKISYFSKPIISVEDPKRFYRKGSAFKGSTDLHAFFNVNREPVNREPLCVP